MTDLSKTEKLYLDDLAVGAEFNSEKYVVVAEEIREFAKNFDPQPFHLDEETARKTLFVVFHWKAGSSVQAVRLAGQDQPDREMCLTL
jgi:acyl dehydratase